MSLQRLQGCSCWTDAALPKESNEENGDISINPWEPEPVCSNEHLFPMTRVAGSSPAWYHSPSQP